MSSRQRIIKKLFVSYFGDPPYPCVFCDEPVDELGYDGWIHHKDEDPTNNRRENLGASHPTCHARHHNSHPATEETKAKMRVSQARRRARERL